MNRVILTVLLASIFAGCGGNKDVHTYDNSLFQLASGFAAKEICSCVFVAEQDEEACDEWTRVSPNVAGHHVDYNAKTVRSRSLGMGKTIARYVDEQTGCVIVRE